MHSGSADHLCKLSDKATCDSRTSSESDTTRSTCSRPIFWHTFTDLWTLKLHVIQGCPPNEGCVAGPSWQDDTEYSVRYIWAQLVVPPRRSKDWPFSKRNVLVHVTYLLGLPMPLLRTLHSLGLNTQGHLTFLLQAHWAGTCSPSARISALRNLRLSLKHHNVALRIRRSPREWERKVCSP